MPKPDRSPELYDFLLQSGKLELEEAMARMRISESTARRLFARLEQNGKAIRTHGAIRLPGGSVGEYSFEKLERANLEKKTAIAQSAVAAVQDGEQIFCDSGTTLLCFCLALARRAREEGIRPTVYTNSLANLEALSPLPVVICGGEYRPYRKDFCGLHAEQTLLRARFSQCFLGADGFAAPGAFTTTDSDTARMDMLAMQNAARTSVLLDSSKFQCQAPIVYAALSEVDRVFSDAAIPPAFARLLGDKLSV